MYTRGSLPFLTLLLSDFAVFASLFEILDFQGFLLDRRWRAVDTLLQDCYMIHADVHWITDRLNAFDIDQR